MAGKEPPAAEQFGARKPGVGHQVTTLSVTVSQPRCCKGSALQGSRQTRLVAQSLISHCSMTRNHLSPDSPCRSDGGIPFHVRFIFVSLAAMTHHAVCRRRLYKCLLWAIFGNWRDALIALAVSPGPLSPLSLPGLTSSLQPTAIYLQCTLPCLMSLGYVVKMGRATSCRRHTTDVLSVVITSILSP